MYKNINNLKREGVHIGNGHNTPNRFIYHIVNG